jgi:hypothetical protein
MNSASIVLTSLEKTASRGLVLAALEAATGGAIGGVAGVAQARKGRAGEPIGTSDVAGAAYGAVLGALAGASVAALSRSAAIQRGIKADMRLKSMAEHAAITQNRSEIAKANLDNWNATAVRDLIYGNHYGTGTYSQLGAAKGTATDMLHSLQQQKSQVHTEIRRLGKAGQPVDPRMYQQMSDLGSQITDTRLDIAGMNQRLRAISKIESEQAGSAKDLMQRVQDEAKKRTAELEAYHKIVSHREKLKAQSRFFGVV